MRRVSVATLASLLALASAVHPQQTPSSPQAAAIREKVSHLSPNARISVIPITGEEEFGRFISQDQESFTLHDVDRNLDVTLRYDAVRKIKNGYGGYNTVTHRHVDRSKNFIVAAAIAGALVALVIAAAVAA